MHKKVRNVIALCGAGALVTAMAACSSTSSSTVSSTAVGSSASSGSTGGGDLSILAIAAQSGILAAVGKDQAYGVKAAVTAINAAGGVNGKPLTVTFKDDASTGTQAVTVLQQALTSGSRPDVVFPGSTSTETVPVAPLLMKYKIFTVTHSATTALSDTSKYPYLFGTIFPAAQMEDNLAATLVAKGFKKVAIVSSDDELGQSSSGTLKSALQARGVATSLELVPDTSVDATPQLSALKAANPDALVIDNFGPSAAAVLKARAELGWNVPAYGSEDLAANNLSQIATSAQLKGIVLQCLAYGVIGNPAQQTAAFKTFYQGVSALNGGQFTFGINDEVVGWDDVVIAAAAANKAHSTDAAAMQAAAETLTTADAPLWIGPAPIGYSATNHYPVFGSSIWVYVPAGPVVHGSVQPPS
jgi:branched-chain amino acid transport system substrate-binding protein